MDWPSEPRNASSRRAGPSAWLVGLLTLGLVQIILVAPHLLYPDLVSSYPFPGGDGPDWIANALYYAGYDVRFSGRPPLVPLVLAALEHFSLMPWYPVLTWIAYQGAALTAYLLVAPAHGRLPAAAVTLALMLNASGQQNALLVMADVPAVWLLLLATVAFVEAEDHPRLYPAAGALAGLSAVTQQTALLFPLPALVTLILTRRVHLLERAPRRWLALGTLAFAIPVAAWFMSKQVAFGHWGDLGIRQWSLLSPHLDSLDFYLASALSLLGWPGVVLGLVGVGMTLLRLHRRGVEGRSLFTLVLVATILGFFVFLYDWESKRFLLYALFPSALFLAAPLARLPRPVALAVATVLIVWSAWPQPRPRLSNRWLIWPVPTLEAVRMGPSDQARWTIKEASGADLFERTTAVRVRRAHALYAASVHPPLPDPGRFAADRSAVLLADGSLDETRYFAVTRPGNILRKRVKLVPADLYPRDWWGWRGIEAVATLKRYLVFRIPLAPAAGPYLVLVSRASPLAAALSAPELRTAPPPAAGRLRRDVELARSIDARTARPEGVLVVLPLEPGIGRSASAGWSRLLPFVSRTTNLFVPDRSSFPAMARAVGRGRILRKRKLDGVLLLDALIAGQRVQIVRPSAGLQEPRE